MLLDAELLDGTDPTAWGKEQLLAGLLSLDLVHCLRYSDDGPPASVPREAHVVGEVVPGWAVVRDGVAVTVNGASAALSSLEGNYQDVAEADTKTDVYRNLDPATATARRRADALAARVAEAIGSDLFITAREYLHLSHWGLADGVTILDVPEGLAALGLYLRAQGQYVLGRFPDSLDSVVTSRYTFFRLGSWTLLPSAWRWLRATAQYAHNGGDGRLVGLVHTLVQRVARALPVRDKVHLALNQPPDRGSAEESLAALDEVLVLLMAALDVSALVAHTVLKLDGRRHSAKWQYPEWLKKVNVLAPDLAAMFDAGTRANSCLAVLRGFRNLVHDETLGATVVGTFLRAERTVVRVPPAIEEDFEKGLAGLGGREVWGVQTLVPGQLHIDAGTFVEQLVSEVLAMLNVVMDRTPVESLPGVSLHDEDIVPPHDPHGLFNEHHLESVRWQLGL